MKAPYFFTIKQGNLSKIALLYLKYFFVQAFPPYVYCRSILFRCLSISKFCRIHRL